MGFQSVLQSEKIHIFPHVYDTNSIHAVPIKSRHADHIVQVWEQIYNLLKHHGEAPELRILDNECYVYMIHSFNSSGVTYC